jgi:hypothetical protein
VKIHVVLAGGILVEVDNDSWHATEPMPGNAIEVAAEAPPEGILIALNGLFPTTEFPPDRPREVAEKVIAHPLWGGRITAVIDEGPLVLPEGAIA